MIPLQDMLEELLARLLFQTLLSLLPFTSYRFTIA